MSESSELFSVLRFSLRDQTIDLDQAWHGIHFTLTGSPDAGCYPLDFLVGGGIEVGTASGDFGPPRAFSPDEVREIWRSFQPMTREVFRDQFSAGALAENQIYPKNLWDPSSECDLDYLLPYFSRVLKKG